MYRSGQRRCRRSPDWRWRSSEEWGAGQLCAPPALLPSLPASHWGQEPGMRLLQVVASTNVVMVCNPFCKPCVVVNCHSYAGMEHMSPRSFSQSGNLVLGAERQRYPGRPWLVSPPVMFLIQLLFSPKARCENQHCTAGPQCGHHARKRRSPTAKGWHWWQGYQPAFRGEALSSRTLGIFPPLLSCHH